VLAAGLIGLAGFAGCGDDNEGPAEDAGKVIDEAGSEAGQEIEEGGKEVEQEIDEADDDDKDGGGGGKKD
jgi:hypothetical protein